MPLIEAGGFSKLEILELALADNANTIKDRLSMLIKENEDIDFSDFLGQLARHDLRPTVTLEAHRTAELDHSLAWLDQLSDRVRYFQISS